MQNCSSSTDRLIELNALQYTGVQKIVDSPHDTCIPASAAIHPSSPCPSSTWDWCPAASSPCPPGQRTRPPPAWQSRAATPTAWRWPPRPPQSSTCCLTTSFDPQPFKKEYYVIMAILGLIEIDGFQNIYKCDWLEILVMWGFSFYFPCFSSFCDKVLSKLHNKNTCWLIQNWIRIMSNVTKIMFVA